MTPFRSFPAPHSIRAQEPRCFCGRPIIGVHGMCDAHTMRALDLVDEWRNEPPEDDDR